MADWSRLPYDLIAFIANKLQAVEDFLAVSAVCRSWRILYLNKSWTPSRRIPWLMLNENHNSEIPKRCLFSLCNIKVYNLPLPEAHGCRCWGSSHGWIITVSRDLEISLLNPVTRVCIGLPPHSTLGSQGHANFNWFNFIQKATVFKIRGGFVTMAIYGHQYSLAFARPEDSAWTTVEISTPFLSTSVVCFKDQIFALSMVGTLVLVQINGPDPPRAIYIASPPKDEKGWQQIHLVESSEDLLMVFRYKTDVVSFKVYKFDFNATEWMQLKSLRDRVLFLDDSYSTSVSACEKFKNNSIYFVKESFEWWLAYEPESEMDYCGVYNMIDKTTESFSFYLPNYTIPIWVMPTL